MDTMNKQILGESPTAYSSRLPKVVPTLQTASTDQTYSIEELRPGRSSYFPQDLPTRPTPPPATAPWRQFMRHFWTFSLSSYSIIHTPDGAARMRHIAMVIILVLRTAMSALSILSVVIKGSIGGIVLYSLLALLTFWFTATCLAIIGDAEGDKRIKGVVVVGYIHFLHINTDAFTGPYPCVPSHANAYLYQKRWHLDAFLGSCVLIHIGLIVAWFFGLTGWGLELTSIGMWLAILAVAWVAGWQPDLPTYRTSWAA